MSKKPTTPPPTVITFSITQQCNLKCKHCYSRASKYPGPNELTTKDALRVIDEVKEVGAKLIIFDGGEPTLRPDLIKLISHAKNVGLIPVLGTNGTTMTQKMARDLKNAGIYICAVSLDGANAQTHDNFRGVPGSFNEAIRGINYLNNEGIIFQINPCIHSKNYHELPKLVDLAKDLGANNLEAFEFVRTGRGSFDYELDILSRQEMINEMLELHNDIKIRMIAAPQYDILYQKNINHNHKGSCCGAGKTIACIFNDGSVYPCMLLQESVGNIKEQSFTKIWERSEVLMKLRDRNNLKGTCGNCINREKCGGARCRAYANGDIFNGDPECWIYEPQN